MNIGQEETQSRKELARKVLCQYRSLCRIAGVDYVTGVLLDSCTDQQNQRQNMALTEVNRIRKAIEGIPSAIDKRILEMSFIEQKRCLLMNKWIYFLFQAVTITGARQELYLSL